MIKIKFGEKIEAKEIYFHVVRDETRPVDADAFTLEQFTVQDASDIVAIVGSSIYSQDLSIQNTKGAVSKYTVHFNTHVEPGDKTTYLINGSLFNSPLEGLVELSQVKARFTKK